MGLRWWSLLECSINIKAGLGAWLTDVCTPPRETLAAASCRSNSEAQATRVVLAHPRAAFHPCMCGLRRGVAAIVAALIECDDVEFAAGTTTRSRSWSTTFSTSTRDCVGSLLQLFFRCSACLVVMIHDLLLTSILGWHCRSSVSVAYPFPYTLVLRVHPSSGHHACAPPSHLDRCQLVLRVCPSSSHGAHAPPPRPGRRLPNAFASTPWCQWPLLLRVRPNASHWTVAPPPRPDLWRLPNIRVLAATFFVIFNWCTMDSLLVLRSSDKWSSQPGHLGGVSFTCDTICMEVFH
jgi:hypothetical protein